MGPGTKDLFWGQQWGAREGGLPLEQLALAPFGVSLWSWFKIEFGNSSAHSWDCLKLSSHCIWCLQLHHVQAHCAWCGCGNVIAVPWTNMLILLSDCPVWFWMFHFVASQHLWCAHVDHMHIVLLGSHISLSERAWFTCHCDSTSACCIILEQWPVLVAVTHKNRRQ